VHARHARFLAGILLSLLIPVGCAKANLVPDTTLPASEDPNVNQTPEDLAQGRVDLVMAALGDAYRDSVVTSEVTERAVASLLDGFAGVAYEAEEANLRDAIDNRNSLARVPANPALYVDIVIEGTDQCQVVEAVFDDRPLQAFPVAGEGIPVVVRLISATDEPVWRIDLLASAAQLSGRPVTCSDVSQARVTQVATTAV
jgi:hypothetical protein